MADPTISTDAIGVGLPIAYAANVTNTTSSGKQLFDDALGGFHNLTTTTPRSTGARTSATATSAQPVADHEVLPQYVSSAEEDDLHAVPPGSTRWHQFRHNAIVKRVSTVLITLAVGAVVLVIINLAMSPKAVKCATPEDCREIRRVNTILSGVKSLLNLVIGFTLFFVVLATLGVNTKALLATAGIVGIIIGLGAQPAIRSFIAGLTFVINDRFSIGDYITLDLAGAENVKGIVTAFTTQATTVQDFSGAKYYVPNGNINVVVNYSQNDQRAQVELQISYAGDIDMVLREIQELNTVMATAEPLRGKMTRPPVLKGLTSNGPYSYTITVTAIAEPLAQMFVERYMRYRLIRLMQHLGVSAAAVVYTKAPGPAASPSPAAPGSAPLATPPPDDDHETFDEYENDPNAHNTMLATINVEAPTDATPETERGDVTVRNHTPLIARRMRYDSDVIHDGTNVRAANQGRGYAGHLSTSATADVQTLDA